jgi:hypothetical protein
MAALAVTTYKPPKTHQGKKAKVAYISSFKKRNKVKPYAKFDLDWRNIKRADNPEKLLAEAAVMLVSGIAYQLHNSGDKPVYLTGDWFEKTTKKQRHQNARLRNQLNHIFNFKRFPRKFHNGEMLYNVHEVSWTPEAYKILNFEDVVIEQETSSNTSADKLHDCSKNAPPLEHKSYNHIEDKEIKTPTGFCISDNEKLKIKTKAVESEAVKEIDLKNKAEFIQPSEKSSLGDDFLTPLDNEVGSGNEDSNTQVATVAKNTNNVITAQFNRFEPPQATLEPNMALVESLSPLPQQTTETEEVIKMIKPEIQREQEQQETQPNLNNSLLVSKKPFKHCTA